MIKSKFKLAIPLSALLLLSSCRTEELLYEIEQKQELSKKFITFTKKHENDVIDYAQGFKHLALKYDSIHKTNMTGARDIRSIENNRQFSINDISYIDFNFRSQLIEEENGDKWMVFPRVKGGEVENLVVALLSEEETLLSYYTISEESEVYKENISKFIEVYKKKQQKNWDIKASSYTTFTREVRGDIEGVDLIGFRPKPIAEKPDIGLGGPPPITGIITGIAFDGGCSAFSACDNGGGGAGTSGSSTPSNNNPNNGNPCEEMKNKNTSPLYQQKVNELNKPTIFNDKKETGYVEDRHGKFTELKSGQSTANSDSMIMVITKNTRGYVHTHQNEYETGKVNDDGEKERRIPIKMFSPQDVDAVMDIANMRDNGDYADIYGTMVASNGIYTIKFTGTKNDIKLGFSGKEWNDQYIKFMEKESGSLETKFLRFMKEKMGISGISLFKTEKNGEVKKYELNNKNKAEKSDCK